MASFDIAVEIVLKNEGGYSENPDDPGGCTNFGISQRAYPDLDIKDLTIEQAKEIYLRDYWKFGGVYNQSIANKVFDSYVNIGEHSIKIAQECLGIIQDGIYGPQTERAINSMSAIYFLNSYRAGLIDYYQNLVVNNPKLGVFLTGWLNRTKQ
jgi:lysozyme family protein